MTGVKGRSGKVTTPEQREARRVAAKAGSDAHRKNRGAGAMGEDDDAIDPEVVPPRGRPLDDEEILSLLPGTNSYDRVVLKSRNRFTYLDGKTREQVRGVELANLKADADLQQTKGKLLTRDQVEARDEAADEVIFSHLDALATFAGSLVPPEQGVSARIKAQAWVNEARAKIAAELDALRT